MKVFIKNKIISIGGGSTVTNEKGEDIYKVEGKLITVTKKKRMYDMQGKLLYTIRNKYWTFFSHKVFVIDAEGHKVATIKKGKLSLNLKYQILGTEDEMSIQGKFFRGVSYIIKNGKEVASITRDPSLIRDDAFTLEAEEADIPFYTALVIAFDNINDTRHEDNTK